MYSDNLINNIIEYLNTQDESLICNNISIAEKTILNSACIEFLSWLKLERKRENWISEGRNTSLKPLVLNENYEWCILLKTIISEESLFNGLFEVKDNCISFKESIPQELKSHIREDAFSLYNPPRFE